MSRTPTRLESSPRTALVQRKGWDHPPDRMQNDGELAGQGDTALLNPPRCAAAPPRP